MHTEINFRLAGSEQHFILVSGYVNDKGPYNFNLNTGAGISLLSPALAQNLEIANRETKEALGAGGRTKVELGSIGALSIGQTRIENIQVAITDELNKISNCCNVNIDVNIGYNFLKHFRVTIDYLNNSLILSQENNKPKDKVINARGKVKFALAHPAKPLVLVPAFVNGDGPYQFVVDTGASITMLSNELAQSLGIKTKGSSEILGVGGMVQASQEQIDSLAIGTLKSHNLTIMVSEFINTLNQVVGKKLDGIVGFNFLRDFRVTIDYPNEVLHLS